MKSWGLGIALFGVVGMVLGGINKDLYSCIWGGFNLAMGSWLFGIDKS